MEKRKNKSLLFVFVLIILVLFFVLASANLLGSFWNKFTGKVIDSPYNGSSTFQGYWTEWYNIDIPSGTGDFELASQIGNVCNNYSISRVECQTEEGANLTQAGQKVDCRLEGLSCLNSENNGSCLNYKVRFLCESFSCLDTDGGKNYYVPGKVYINNLSLGEDFCSSEQNSSLVEFFCLQNGSASSEEIKCPNGCLNGECLLHTNENISSEPSIIFKQVNSPSTGIVECESYMCGPQLGASSYLCSDGKTFGGPTGRCISFGGSCGWEVSLCDSNQTSTECLSGCLQDGKCLPFGYQINETYCSESKTFVNKLDSNLPCGENFECLSGTCSNGKCSESVGLIQKVINWITGG